MYWGKEETSRTAGVRDLICAASEDPIDDILIVID
jgi:hypothetical protein